MKDIDKLKLVFVSFFTTIHLFLGVLAVPFYILVGCNIVDYITGIIASVYRGEKVSSNVGYRGIAKKICMWLLVAVGYVLDYLIITFGSNIGINLEFKCLIAVAVVLWLLVNELISILENISDIGTPLPPFLLKVTQLLKSKTEEVFENEKACN